jgi:hypothetical protein
VDFILFVVPGFKDWEAKQARKFEETEKLAYDNDDTEFSDEVRSYLEKNSPVIKPMK